VQILPAAQMGGQREIIESVSIGTLEMGYGESGLYANYVPPFGIIALPYSYRDFEHWTRVVDGEVGAELAGSLERQSGIRILNWMTAGYRNTFLRTKPVAKPADFRGVKIRLPEAPVFVRTFSTLGALPTPIPAPEMYSALQTGVVDAMEGSAEVGFTFKIHEVTKFLSKTRHILLDGSFAVNAAFFNEFVRAERQALTAARRRPRASSAPSISRARRCGWSGSRRRRRCRSTTPTCPPSPRPSPLCRANSRRAPRRRSFWGRCAGPERRAELRSNPLLVVRSLGTTGQVEGSCTASRPVLALDSGSPSTMLAHRCSRPGKGVE
jgi:tripartite ATP-independent transporter DctP family solute receptor